MEPPPAYAVSHFRNPDAPPIRERRRRASANPPTLARDSAAISVARGLGRRGGGHRHANGLP